MEQKSKDKIYIKLVVIAVILYAVYSNPSSRKTIDDVTGEVTETINTVENTIAPTSPDTNTTQKSDSTKPEEVSRWRTSDETSPVDSTTKRINLDEDSRINSAIRNYVLPKVEENIRYDLMRKGIIGDHSVIPGEFKTIAYKPKPGSYIALCGSKVQLHYRVTDDKGKVYIDTRSDKEEPITVTLGSDTENVIPKGVELALLGMSEKSIKMLRVAKDLLDHPDIIFNKETADETSKQVEGELDTSLGEVEKTSDNGDTKESDTKPKYNVSYLVNLELVSIDADTRKANPEFLKVFDTSHSFKEIVTCGDPVVIEYQLFKANGAAISNSRHKASVIFNIGDEIIPHNLERAFYGVKYNQKRSALMSNNLEKNIKTTKYQLLRFYKHAKEPYYIEFTLSKPNEAK
ncbi:MAG: FKBP-type peptidyl-prolyl cis-trans isomerase [Rickettsiales bacterium]|nr:FKBP-type peptidyl-prolyl cis-trans isomerase [Rickettsiales bacterium]